VIWEMFLQLFGIMTILAIGGWLFVDLVDRIIYNREDKDERD